MITRQERADEVQHLCLHLIAMPPAMMRNRLSDKALVGMLLAVLGNAGAISSSPSAKSTYVRLLLAAVIQQGHKHEVLQKRPGHAEVPRDHLQQQIDSPDPADIESVSSGHHFRHFFGSRTLPD